MKVSFICPVRNKARHVQRAVASILRQTYSSMEIVISDQGSTDGTLEIIQRMADGYSGPNTVRVLSCPDTAYRGMIGLNAHLNFIESQIEGDIVIMCSGDDYNHPERATRTVRAFEEHNPSYVNTGVCYANPNGEVINHTDFPDRRSRWLEPEETIVHQIGSNGSSAWARDLYRKHGPLIDCEQQDMVLPMMALFDRGIWYHDEVLYTYVMHASLENAGITGQIAAAKDNPGHHNRLVEINNFIHVFNWCAITGRWQSDPEAMRKLAEAGAMGALIEKLTYTASVWSMVRNELIVARIPPIQMNV